MGLRLSGLSTFNLFQRALENRNRDIFKTAEQMSSGKRINRPADDPAGAQMVLSYREGLEKVQQYGRNLQVGERYLKESETALTGSLEILKRAKELAIQGNNATLSDEAREALADEVVQLRNQLLALGNTEINGEYIFSGFKTTTKPFTGEPVTYSGDANIRSVSITDDSTLEIQIDGNEAFMGSGLTNGVDIFDAMKDLEDALRANDTSPTSATGIPEMIDKMGDAHTQLTNELTTVGAKLNRVESLKAQIDVQTETLTSFISNIEDVDLPTIVLEFQKAQTALQATITSAGNVFNLPSVMDFIR